MILIIFVLLSKSLNDTKPIIMPYKCLKFQNRSYGIKYKIKENVATKLDKNNLLKEMFVLNDKDIVLIKLKFTRNVEPINKSK